MCCVGRAVLEPLANLGLCPASPIALPPLVRLVHFGSVLPPLPHPLALPFKECTAFPGWHDIEPDPGHLARGDEREGT
jgi:hypothetical protein